ncbi:MAG: 50S ribosomal protein L30 [Chloroflexi bacterium]|jgi:large subunit ribosomal protein L30|nr:MAG: 50S ribosomal protein L30 [Chloroflexota bacterium]
MANRKVKITYAKSAIGYNQKQKATLRALGLRRLGESIERELTPAINGMIDKVPHLVKVEDVQA